VGFYKLKPDITGKQQSKSSEQRKKQQLTENQKSNDYRNITKMGTQFLHLACQRGGSHPCTPVSHTNCCSPVLYPFTVQEYTIPGI